MHFPRKIFINKLNCKGPIKTVIFDLEGTIIDKGCMAPVEAITKLFSNYRYDLNKNGYELTKNDIRKNLHINRVEYITSIAKIISKDINIKELLENYNKIQEEHFDEYNNIIEGSHTLFGKLREENINIGAISPSYDDRLSTLIGTRLIRKNLIPDRLITNIEEFELPSPALIYKCLNQLDTYPLQSVVKVDDTPIGIKEGLNAGCWTIGVSKWSSLCNYQSKFEIENMSELERNKRERIARKELLKSGAHFVVSDLSYVFDVIQLINNKLRNNEQPHKYIARSRFYK